MSSFYVKCPYFNHHVKRVISCEGFIDKTSNQINLHSDKRATMYKQNYCMSAWETCAHAKALNEFKYKVDSE